MNEPTSSIAEKILQSLRNKPGQKARDLSNSLKVERSEINSILHGLLRGKVIQDKNYRWWPKDEAYPKPQPDGKISKLNTPLAKLCRYYLDCLNYDDQGGVSVFATGKFGLDYTELSSLPFFNEEPNSLLDSEEVRRLINKIRRDKSRLSLVLGYPVCLTKIRSKKGWEGFFVEPILIFPFQQDPSNKYALPTFNDELPQINYKAMRSLMGSDSTSLVEEVVQLAEEMGFAATDTDAPDVDEIILRLRDVRPEWNWKEELDPLNISSGQPLSDIEFPGIYNRAVLMVVERSPFTKGLETELSNLQSITEDRYRNTALGA
jgi:hypothetical protein